LVFIFLHFFNSSPFFFHHSTLHSSPLMPMMETGRQLARACGASYHIYIHKQPSSANPQAPLPPPAALVAPSAAAAPPTTIITTTTTTTTTMQASSFHRQKH
jgi:hypothetical protein